VYDFVDKELGRANPHGVYDLANNAGWVSVGMDHDTASFGEWNYSIAPSINKMIK
jgi:hypothetical protein